MKLDLRSIYPSSDIFMFTISIFGSEHSRHWFFRGRLEVDGEEHPVSLFKMIMETQEHSSPNNVIKFSDNSRSADQGLLRLVKAAMP